MIRLTKVNGKAWYVNPEQIVDFGNDSEYGQTLVQTTKNGWYVTESPAEIARKVLEWRLEIEAYKSLVTIIGAESARCTGNLRRLTRLEEQA